MKKIVLVTGGSRGIGKATSVALSRQGYFVCINYKSDTASAEVLRNQIKKEGGQACIVKADISVEEDVIKLFQYLDSLEGELTGLVNNAGKLAEQASLIDMTAARIKDIFETNILSVFLCSREAVKRMNVNGGAIVNISSGAAKSGSPNEYLDYAASKGAIDTFTLGLAREVAHLNIRVNGIRPGFIETEMHTIPNRLETIKSKIPMNRIGKPEEIAKTVAWLISENSSYTSGAIIDIAGGR